MVAPLLKDQVCHCQGGLQFGVSSFWPCWVGNRAAMERICRISSTGLMLPATSCAGRERVVLFTISVTDLPQSSLGALFMSRKTKGWCWGQLAVAMGAFRASLSHMCALSTMLLLCRW